MLTTEVLSWCLHHIHGYKYDCISMFRLCDTVMAQRKRIDIQQQAVPVESPQRIIKVKETKAAKLVTPSFSEEDVELFLTKWVHV